MFMEGAGNRSTGRKRPDKMPCSRPGQFGGRGGGQYSGGVAQLGERVNGIHEVRGSIPLASMASRAVDESRLSGYICCRHAGIAQLVEHNLAKVGVAGSSPVSRSPVGRLKQATRGGAVW